MVLPFLLPLPLLPAWRMAAGVRAHVHVHETLQTGLTVMPCPCHATLSARE